MTQVTLMTYDPWDPLGSLGSLGSLGPDSALLCPLSSTSESALQKNTAAMFAKRNGDQMEIRLATHHASWSEKGKGGPGSGVIPKWLGSEVE